MPDATVRANAQVLPDQTEAEPISAKAIAGRIRFDAAYSEWLAARAAVSNPGGDGADEAQNRLYAREREAEAKLIHTQAPLRLGGP